MRTQFLYSGVQPLIYLGRTRRKLEGPRTTKNLSADKKRRKMNIWKTYTTEISSDFFPQMNVSGSASASRIETTQHDKKSKTIKIRKRIILGSWIRIRIRVKSWIRICIKVKVLQLQRLKNGTTESHGRSKLRCGVYVGQQLPIHITLMRSRIRIRFKVKIGFGSAWKWKKNPNSDPQKVMWENDSENNTYLIFCGPYHSKI
jgi:hypothetical protein